MKFEDSNWFSKWEDELPSPEELTPISQSLITPDLANAFDITTAASGGATLSPSPEMGSMAAGNGSGSEEPARTLKRPRLVWTPQLHKRFVDAVAHLGIKNAVPKTIMQLMSVDGLTRENVASHLQKYRLYLKRMQGQNGNSNGGLGGGVAMDAASERLFASSPVPAHFLSPVRGGSEPFVPFVNVGMLPHQQQQQPMVGIQGQCLRPVGGFGMHNGQFDGSSFLPRQGQQGGRIGVGGYGQGMNCVEDLENGNGNGGRKVLTLFPDN